MTVVGSDNFADAPTLPVGFSSAYTPNSGYTTEVGEPTAWGGKTAWWKVIPTVSEFHYIDVLYSTGSTRAWVYRQDGSGFGGLLMVSNPGADTQGGWNANAGSTYYVRLDSDGSDVSYVASVGMQVYDEYVERYPLTGPRPDPDLGDGAIRELYFAGDVPDADPSGWRERVKEIIEDAVSGAPGLTESGSYAEILMGQYVGEVIDEYPDYHEGLSWYGDPPDTTYGHPLIGFAVTSEDAAEAITIPPDYDAFQQLVIIMSASTGESFEVGSAPHYPVSRIQVDGAFNVITPVRNLDRNGSSQGSTVEVDATLSEYLFRPPATFADLITDYNAGTLYVSIIPDRVTDSPLDPTPAPTGIYRFAYVALQVTFISDDPLPYELPPPPLALTYVRQHPTAHAGTWGGTPRIYPPPKVQRIIGGHT